MSSCCKDNILCCSSKRVEKDVFERCYTFTSQMANDDFTLWEADGVINTCGTLVFEVVSIDPTGGSISIFLNGDTTPVVMNLTEGDSIILTSDPLTLIEIEISANNTTVKVSLCLTINYECC